MNEMKAEAIKRMQQLKLDEDVIRAFKDNDILKCSEYGKLIDVPEDVQRVVDYLLKPKSKPTSDDCVSRQAVLDILSHYAHNFGADNEIKALSSVTPTHGTCKDCKHWKDSDGVYRRGIGAESKCPVNSSRVFEGTFCCAAFEKRGNEDGSN